MRAPAFLLLIVMALFAGRAYGDARTDAKVHYQAGVKAYSAQDYRTAIKEFNAAQSLMPADLNSYNLALCYDKLGEAEPAIQNYKDFLAKVPNADKRTEIEASISRLEAALQSAAAKRADEQKKADAAKAAEEAARKAEEAKQADAAKKAADEEAKKKPPVEDPNAATSGAVGVGSTGTPGTGQAVSTGDVQLDRVSAIDVNQIRNERMGGGASGVPTDNRGAAGPAGPAGPVGPAAGPAGGPTPANATGPATPAPTGNMVTDKPVKKEAPVYKKWWFWAVVAVSAYVVISIATDGSSNQARAREGMLDTPGAAAANPSGGLTLMSF